MGLSKEKINNLALRYLSMEDIVDYPMDGDLFCLLMREAGTDKVLAEDEGWAFTGYGQCIGYTYDEEAKPVGKWLWMSFASLASFPPSLQTLRLQPPHVALGRFRSADGSQEIRIVKVHSTSSSIPVIQKKKKGPAGNRRGSSRLPAQKKPDNILTFRPKKGTPEK